MVGCWRQAAELSDYCGQQYMTGMDLWHIKCKSTHVTASEWDNDVCSLHNTCDRKLVSYLVSLPSSVLGPSLNRWGNGKGQMDTT